MSKEKIIVGLDIGSSSIKVVVAEQPKVAGAPINIIGGVESPTFGISRGNITSIDDVTSSISTAIDRAERSIGLPIERAWIGISGVSTLTQLNRGVVAVSHQDQEIRLEDIERAMEAAKTNPIPNYEILHVIPRCYLVDGVTVQDPVGMTGIRLEVEAYVIQVLASWQRNLSQCVHRANLEIDDVSLGILPAADALLTQRQKELGVALVNLGASSTSVMIFEGGEIKEVAVLPIGSLHITTDLMLGLKIPLEVAETLKLHFGTAAVRTVGKKEEINLYDVGYTGEEFVSKKKVAEIIEARAEEIFLKINNVFKKNDYLGRLPAGIVLTGGGAKLPGLVDIGKKETNMSVAVGYPFNFSSYTDTLHDPAFGTAIGLVGWSSDMMMRGASPLKSKFSLHFMSGMKKGLRDWIRGIF